MFFRSRSRESQSEREVSSGWLSHGRSVAVKQPARSILAGAGALSALLFGGRSSKSGICRPLHWGRISSNDDCFATIPPDEKFSVRRLNQSTEETLSSKTIPVKSPRVLAILRADFGLRARRTGPAWSINRSFLDGVPPLAFL